jgi:hypothetical protein
VRKFLFLVLALLVILAGLPLMAAMPVMADCPRCLLPAGGGLGLCLAVLALFALVAPGLSGRFAGRRSFMSEVLFVADIEHPPRPS